MSKATLDEQRSQLQALRGGGPGVRSDHSERDEIFETTSNEHFLEVQVDGFADLGEESLNSVPSQNIYIRPGSNSLAGQEMGSMKKDKTVVKAMSAPSSDETLVVPLDNGSTSSSPPINPNRFSSLKRVYNSIRNRWMGVYDLPPSNGRHIDLDPRVRKPLIDARSAGPYINNNIHSNKYTLWTFLPKQLLAQFSKLANFYFLCISILQLIPGLSTTGSYTTIVPLIFFVSISMAKEGYDDLRRHRLDKAENTSSTLVLENENDSTVVLQETQLAPDTTQWVPKKWEQLRVGDVIKLKEDEAVPADIILLQVDGKSKLAFVETIALDGETDLKSKSPPPGLLTHYDALARVPDHQTYLTIEDPNLDLYNFHGTVTIRGHTTPLTNNEVLYRGSIIRNTPGIIAVVIYSGEECKIRMNAMKNPRTKAPAMQAIVNKVVIIIVVLVLFLAIVNTTVYYIWRPTEERWSYLIDPYISFFPLFISFIILFNTMIPLSLYVSLEIVKVFQIYFLNDLDMYDEDSHTPMEARTSTINEDLGQVSHIFSDKTGTLTENSMRFRKMSVAGTAWLHDYGSGDCAVESDETAFQCGVNEGRTSLLRMRLLDEPKTAFANTCRDFLTFIALCHTCTPEAIMGRAIKYKGASPDELSLVQAAADLGFTLMERAPGSLTISSLDKDGRKTLQTYQVLQIIEFSTKRRRMSIIVRMPDDCICIICKGADSTVMGLLRLSTLAQQTNLRMKGVSQPRDNSMAQRENENSVEDVELFARCFEHVDAFANEGLRTLLYAYRYVSDAEYQRWKVSHDEAARSFQGRQIRIEEAANLIEVDLELAGATAIEDKLQRGVPASINQLHRAGIKIWMLTGDKQETAINIGHSCGLIQNHSKLLILDQELVKTLVDELTSVSELMADKEYLYHSVIVINGNTLSMLEEEKGAYLLFTAVASQVDSVICCRASPSQKASLVRAIRNRVKNAVTLAIGDGANDIAMIQEAHVGIGITGKEGRQAARSSDYSIAQFRFLSKLLLVHGRWNYIRICKYTLGTFWKEMLFYMTQALYQRYDGYSGTSLYESWSLSLFNTLFTSLPVIFMGIFEQDLNAETLLAAPELYKIGQRNGGFNIWIYLEWVTTAICESTMIFFLMYALFGSAFFTNDSDLFTLGALTFTACVIVINTKIQFIELHHKTVTTIVALVLSIGGWFLWNIILNRLYGNNYLYDVRDNFLDHFGRDATWWLTLIVIVTAFCVFEAAVKYTRKSLRPSDVDTFRALEKNPQSWERIKAAARENNTPYAYGDSAKLIDVKGATFSGDVEMMKEAVELPISPNLDGTKSKKTRLQRPAFKHRGTDDNIEMANLNDQSTRNETQTQVAGTSSAYRDNWDAHNAMACSHG
ncbi:MAG: hypothetical protein MMC33_005927 [Icmadophila ericetorum]|nr:hypothetical protein [Icmadophila ericetorum]